MSSVFSGNLTLDILQRLIHSVEGAALLVEPRILRRIIRLDRRLAGFGQSVPHHKSYAIERDRLLAYVERSELGLRPAAELPRTILLLAMPDAEALQDPERTDLVLEQCARLLYHASVHAELERRLVHQPLRGAVAAERREQIGETEFAEIRAVLLKDHYLFPSPTDLETYIEFAAVYLELCYYAPAELPLYFPAIRDWGAIDRVVSQDVDHRHLYQRLLLPQYTGEATDAAQELAGESEELSTKWPPEPLAKPRQPLVSLLSFRQLQAKAERAALVGNGIKAMIWHTRAARQGPANHAAEGDISASGELTRFAQRLQLAAQLPDSEAEAWRAALQPLLAPASDGWWTNEARLLYDLQKVCVEQERGVYRLDLVEWIRTLGARPLRRPLPLLRDASMIRYLRLAGRRVATARIRPEQREQLSGLLASLIARVEHASRERIRPLIAEVFDEVGLVGQNVPEQVARKKLVEELLDHIVERSWLSMGDLRDAVSKNDLKLPDVTSPRELIRGDRLLRADRKLDEVLDGVYRRGAVYLRWPQMLSSMAFGTNIGRFITRYLAVPFGGAYLGAEFVRHIAVGVMGMFRPAPEVAPSGLARHGIPHLPPHPPIATPWMFYACVLMLGFWLSFVLHRPEFRAWNIAMLRRTGRGLRKVFVEFPQAVVHSQLVQQVLHSRLFAVAKSYVIIPGIATALISIPLRLLWDDWSNHYRVELFLVMALAMNTSLGRYATEVTTDYLGRAWRELTIRVFAAALQWIMEVFENLLSGLEQVIYTVDEWLRFRAGDNRWSQSVKAIGGVAWFFISYVVMFVFTLLIEPQINPIKHFPVVTVAHKLILPTGPLFVKQLSPYLGTAEANTLVWTTIWLIPGVFGFLVWELKENWRLYAANRSPVLKPVPIGRHAETMVRLLRPGFHSGTLPKKFAALRRAARKLEQGGNARRVAHRQADLHHAVESVQRFVERELLGLLEQASFAGGLPLQVGEIRVATNRIDVELCAPGQDTPAARLTWEEDSGQLRGGITQNGWLETLSPEDQQSFTLALAGLFRRAGVEQPCGDYAPPDPSPIPWERWIQLWTPANAVPAPHSVPSAATVNR